MSSYRYTYEIQYQEVDANRRLRLYTLENYLLNVAGRASDEQGIGIQYLYPQGLTWVITNLSLELKYIPTYGERICIETWIERDAHLLSTRNYRIYLLPDDIETPKDGLIPSGEPICPEKSQLIGRGKSVWTVLDLNKREIVNVFSQPAFTAIHNGEELDIPRTARMTPIQSPEHQSSRAICYSDVDYNNHCNSCKYLEIMLDTYLPSILTFPFHKADSATIQNTDSNTLANPILRLDINYVKELHLGEIATTLVCQDGNAIRYQIKNAEGLTCSNARITQLR